MTAMPPRTLVLAYSSLIPLSLKSSTFSRTLLNSGQLSQAAAQSANMCICYSLARPSGGESLTSVLKLSSLCPCLIPLSSHSFSRPPRPLPSTKRQLWALHAARQVPMVTGNLPKHFLTPHVTLSGMPGTHEQTPPVDVFPPCIRRKHGRKSCGVQVGGKCFYVFFSAQSLSLSEIAFFSFLNNTFILYMFILSHSIIHAVCETGPSHHITRTLLSSAFALTDWIKN